MPARQGLLALIFALSVALLLCLAPAGAEEVAIDKGSYDYREVMLEELQLNAHTYLNDYVVFECKFSALGNLYKPVQTGLLDVLHQNFFAWGTRAKLWIPAHQSDRACLTLYLVRSSKSWSMFTKLKRYERIQIWGQVRSDLGQAPWIEVRQIDKASGPNIDSEFVASVYEGWSLLGDMSYEKALGKLLPAYSRSLPRMEESALCAYIGECYYALGNYRQAIRYYERAVALDPGDDRLVAMLVKSYYHAQNYDMALALASKALDKDPTLNEIRIIAALSKGQKGDIEGGLADVEFVLLRDQHSIEAFKARSDLFIMRKDYDSALKAVERAILIDQRNVDLQYRRARLFELKGDKAKAKEGYLIALSLAPDHAPSLLALARIAQSEGDQAAATAYLDRATTGDLSAEKLVEIGRFYAEIGNYGKALEYFSLAMRKDPNYPDAFIEAGNAALALGDLRAAEAHFAAALLLVPNDRDARIGLCRAMLWQNKKPNEVLPIARGLLTEYPDMPVAKALTGYALTLTGDAAEGERLAREAVAADPASAEFKLYLGVALAQTKKYGEAKPLLENTVKAGGLFGAIAAPYLDTVNREFSREQARLDREQEKARRDEERRKLAQEKEDARKKARAEREAAKLAARSPEGDETVRTVRKPSVTQPRTPAAEDDGTMPGTRWVRGTDKSRASLKPASKSSEMPGAASTTTPRLRLFGPEEAPIYRPEPTFAEEVPEDFVRRYGYKKYPKIQRPTIAPSSTEIKWLPTVAEAKARILDDYNRRNTLPELEPAETEKRLIAEQALFDKERAEMTARMVRVKARDARNIEYRRNKSTRLILDEMERRQERAVIELAKAHRDGQKASERYDRRMREATDAIRREFHNRRNYVDDFSTEQKRLADKARAEALASAERAERDTADMLEKTQELRESILYNIAKADKKATERELLAVSRAQEYIDRMNADFARRSAEIRKIDQTRRERSAAEFQRIAAEMEKSRQDAERSIQLILGDVLRREAEQVAVLKQADKMEKLRADAREASARRLVAMQEDGDRIMERAARQNEKAEELGDYYTAKFRSKTDAHQSYKDEREGYLWKRIDRKEDARSEARKDASEELERDLKKAREASERRQAELKAAREAAVREAEKMAKRIAEERERIRKEVERTMKKRAAQQEP